VPEEDEDLQITALREELMKEMESVRGDIKSLKTGQKFVLTGLGIFIALCGFVLTALAFAADIF
jgi:hypothetical protein